MSITEKIGKDLAAFLENIEEQYETRISELEDRVKQLDVELEKADKRRICDVEYLTKRINKLEADPNEE